MGNGAGPLAQVIVKSGLKAGTGEISQQGFGKVATGQTAKKVGGEVVGEAVEKSALKTGAGYALLGAGGIAALWALPQILGDSCNRTGEQMGLPPDSCVFIGLSSCIMFCMMSFCMIMMLMMGSGG
jgi:hypothetical protein